MSRGEKRDTNSFNEKITREKKNNNERHQRKQRKEATKEKTLTTPTPCFFRSLARERSKNVLFWIHIYACVCFYSFKVKRRHLFPSFHSEKEKSLSFAYETKKSQPFSHKNSLVSFIFRSWLFLLQREREKESDHHHHQLHLHLHHQYHHNDAQNDDDDEKRRRRRKV